MQLVFTKGHGKYDLLEVRRADGVVERVECPKQGIIPHDMMHCAVENTLEKRGFLRRVKDGELASFRMAPEPESDSVERLVEIFQGDGWSGGRTSPAEMIDLYHVACTERACKPLAVTAMEIDLVRAEIHRLTETWSHTAAGRSLRLSF
ncbi:hypothetical protein MASR1M8_08640 [Thermomonas brevis]